MIRKFLPTDIDDVMAIWLQGNLDAHPFISPHYWRKKLPAVRAAVLQASVYCYVDKNGRVCGFIGMQDDYIAGLFVARHARGHRVGTALLTTVKESHTTLILDVYLRNSTALRFYRQHGFVVTNQEDGEARMTWQAKNNL